MTEKENSKKKANTKTEAPAPLMHYDDFIVKPDLCKNTIRGLELDILFLEGYLEQLKDLRRKLTANS